MAFRTNKVPAIEERTVSGSVATFNTALAMPLVNGEFTIQAYQEGTGDPSPDNVRAFIPVNKIDIYQRGANLWDEDWESGEYDSSGVKRDNPSQIRSKNFCPCKGGVYIYQKAPAYGRILFYDKDYTYISRTSSGMNRGVSVPVNACYFTLYCAVTEYENNISINYPSSDSDYHAYTGNTYTVNLGEDTYGAVYNSVTGGKRTTYKKVIFDGSSDENWMSSLPRFYIILDTLKVGAINDWGLANWLTVGATSTSTSISFGRANNGIYCHHITDNPDINVSSLEEWRAYLAEHPLEVVYPLDEPIETDIGATPIETYDGSNNIFCDTGDTSLTYKDLDIAKRGNFREVFRLPS